MGIFDILKTVFPKPQIPQKRYIMLAALLIYAGLKFYTAHTPSVEDDQLPDKFIGIVTKVLSEDDGKQIVEIEPAPAQTTADNRSFGEQE